MASETPERAVEAHGALDTLRAQALEAVRRYAEQAFTPREFVPGETPVPVAGRVIGAPELEALTDASLDGWLTEGRFARAFSEAFAKEVGRSHALLVGSGSQANLLAVAATTSHLHERPLMPGDEVITPALGFSTTVGPLYQYGLVPVYVDVDLETFNPTLDAIAAAIGDRTRAILVAHCLGNPFDADGVAELCREHDLMLIEDCCDALGSSYGGRPVGTFGEAATFSFYPAHHMTMGEGGAVAADDPTWVRALGSLREWGRDCWCPPGVNDACGRRFDGRFGDLPAGFDHKYVFSHVGFNFKVTDMQASLGLAQLERLEGFGARRRENFARLQSALSPLEDRLVLPRALPDADPSWFGYPFTLRDGASERRRELQRFLLERKIDNRLLLGGNLTRQPGFMGRGHRVVGSLDNADRITEATVWVGCYPGLTDPMVDWIAESIAAFVGR
ncbi:MAG TPA: lipopolysaccharide biosynthesis protein RfbH [Thermoleophilaceae bacterium]|nr:lipopolysaccharide biosynthesis protein RfbH [Thermoleophilaceae bacterium]